MTQTTCPYCGHSQNEPDECYEEDELYETECNACNKIYGISPYYIKGYYEHKMPCANGGKHNWKQINGAPKEYFIGKQRCEYCNEERQLRNGNEI